VAKTVGLSRQVRLLDMSRYRMLWIPKEWAVKLGIPKGGKVIAELVDYEREWWAKYVTGDALPPLDDSKAARRHLDSMPGGPDMEATQEQIALMARLRSLRDTEERIGHDKSDVVRALKQSMVGSYVLAGPDFRATWRPTKERVSTDWRLVAESYAKALLERGASDDEITALVSLYTVTSEGSRPFRPTWIEVQTQEEEAAA